MKKSGLSYEKDLSPVRDIPLSPTVRVVILYTHFMRQTQNVWNRLPHTHPFHELHIALRGSCRTEIGEEVRELRRHDCLWISPGTPHTFLSCSEDFFRFSLAFDIVDENECHLSSAPTSFLSLDGACVTYLENILSEYETGGVGHRFIIDSLVGCLLTDLLRSSGLSDLFPAGVRGQSCLGAAKQWIEEHLSGHMTAPDVASAVFLSTRQLDRIFTENLGMTISRYIKWKRIEIVKEYLQKTDLPLKEIACLAGMENESVLCKTFRKETGTTPKQYRQKAW